MESTSDTRADEITRLGPRQVFHSAEQVAFEVPIAGPTSRILAYAIDSFCVSLLLVALALAIFLLTPAAEYAEGTLRHLLDEVTQAGTPEEQGQTALFLFALLLIAQFAFESLYFIAFELLTGGRSVGKAIVGLRVCLDGGLPVTPSATLMRNLLRIVDVLPVYYLTGLVSMIVSREGKRLGDHAAGTVVIRLDRPPAAPPLPISDRDDPDFRIEREHLAALGADERALLRQTLRRAESLDEARRREVLRRAAEVLRQRLAYRELKPGEEERFLAALLRASARRRA